MTTKWRLSIGTNGKTGSTSDGFGAATQPSGSKLPRHSVGARHGYCVVDKNREQARFYRVGGLLEICGVLKTVGATRLASRY
jgi:hypothetical protein